ncbi:MAG: GNAT family N-acetyltransferase [Proteobacteria bacterium]|uniref:GNAT family N-acetyltransferase n=1 Tax=Aquabacterium sp. TaxID=1872578 RepID=UPI0035C6F02D|nr:GNAT family N-acetyltransferase [Pseudomonadota bacterium]
MLIRPMTPTDLPAVLAVQQRSYAPDFHEPLAAFASKLEGGVDTCWVAERHGDATGATDTDRVLAYLVCLPADAHSLPVLHASRWQRPAQPRWLYLHDLAVGPAAQGLGLGPRLVAQARARARALGLQQMVLVAVQGSVGFWQRQGFAEAPAPGVAVQEKLSSFGEGARFMACGL